MFPRRVGTRTKRNSSHRKCCSTSLRITRWKRGERGIKRRTGYLSLGISIGLEIFPLRGGGKGGTNCRQNELTRARYLCPEGLKLMEDKQPVLNKLRVQPPFVCAGEKGEGFCGPTKYPVRCSPRCSRDNIVARISRIPLPSHFSANSENASRLNAKDELARFSSSSSSNRRKIEGEKSFLSKLRSIFG